MCDGMRLDKRLMLLGIIIVVLSMSMATQYAVTRATYSFAIAHPSNADIRYIGSDNSSDDGLRVYRVTNNVTGAQYATIELGDWMPNSRKNYTAIIGIVNEEGFAVNITHINISGTNATYLSMWLHGDRDVDYTTDGAASVMVIRDGTALYSSSSIAWTLAAGDGVVTSMDGGNIATPWEETSHVRWSVSDTNAANETDDYVWLGISLDIPSDGAVGTPTGTIYIHFKSTTIT